MQLFVRYQDAWVQVVGQQGPPGIAPTIEEILIEAGLIYDESEQRWFVDNGVLWYSFILQYIGCILSNSNGCRIDVDEYGLGVGTLNSNSLKFTLGQGGSSTYIYLRITFTSSASNKYIGQINILDGNWLEK
jgi:hypothetical protein